MDLEGKWAVVWRRPAGDLFMRQDGTWTEEFEQAALFPGLQEALAVSDWQHHVVPAGAARSFAGSGLSRGLTA